MRQISSSKSSTVSTRDALVFEKLAVAVVPGVALVAPYEAHLAKQLDPFLGEEAVLPLASETVLLPLVGNPRPEGLVLRVSGGDQAVLVLGLVFEKLVVAVVPASQLLLPHFGFPHFEKKRKRGVRTPLFQFPQNFTPATATTF